MPIDAQSLKQQIDLREIVARFWGKPSQSRNRYDVFSSRWRDDGRYGSFTVYADRFKDYGGDGISGDVYTFLQQELGISFVQALNWVQEYLGSGVSINPREPRAPQLSINEPPPADWQDAARDLVAQSQQYLWSDHPDAVIVRNYLREVRGLSDESIREAGYGFNRRWEATHAITDPVTGKPYHLAPGIVEPWYADGALWSVRVRTRVGDLGTALGVRPPQQDGVYEKRDFFPKYMNLTGSRPSGAMMNADDVQPGGHVVIVEGGFDAHLGKQILGDACAVVTFGSASSTPSPRRMQQLKAAGRVFLLFDNDDAGKEAARRFKELLPDATIIDLPHGKDLTEFVQAGGDLRGLVERAMRPHWWPQGMPDSVRSAMLRYFRPSAAPVIELVNTLANQGIINSAAFTVNEVIAAKSTSAFELSDGTIRRVMAELCGYFFAEVEPFTTSGVESVSNAAKKGRPSVYYALLPLSTIHASILAWATPRIIEEYHPVEDGVLARPTPAMLAAIGEGDGVSTQLAALFDGLDEVFQQQAQKISTKVSKSLAQLRASLQIDTYSSQLPDNWTFSNATEYRAGLLRATNDPMERRSRREIQRLLGVSNGSVGKMVDAAGLKKASPDGEFVTKKLDIRQDAAWAVREAAYQAKGFPRIVNITEPDGSEISIPYNGEETHPTMQDAAARGASVQVVYQVANRYIEKTAYQPKQRPAPPACEGPEDDVMDLVEPRKPRKARPQPFYGASHDPAWVREQLALLLCLSRGYVAHSEGVWVHPATGELVRIEGLVRALLE